MIDADDKQRIASLGILLAVAVISVIVSAATLGAAVWVFVELSGI